MTNKYFYGLDGVRFFAALSVCVFHLGFYAWAARSTTLERAFAHSATLDALTPVAWPGWVGVQIFFVISGFVIANSANGAAPMAFLRSRVLRLLPAAWICASVTLGVRMLADGESWSGLKGDYFRSLILSLTGGWIDGGYWTLAIEIVFYALVLVLLLTRRFSLLPKLAWSLTLVSATFLILDTSHAAHIGAWAPWFGRLEAVSEILPLKHGVFFALGIWVWMLSNRMLPKGAWAGMAIAVAFGLDQIWVRAIDLQRSEAPAALGQPTVLPLLILLAALALIVACTRWPERFAPRSPTACSRLKGLGQLTYPLYLVHPMLGAWLMRAMIHAGAQPYFAFAAALALAIGAAALIALFLEPALREQFRRMFRWFETLLGRVRPLRFLFLPADTIHAVGPT
jgi:exopolysaccharide production protein ExoZ